MKQEDSEILKKLGKDPGFKTPDHYFADFSKNLMDSLPEIQVTEEPKPSLWNRYKTYVYMAAMFAGIWCMMHIFNAFNGTSTNQAPTEMAAGVKQSTSPEIDPNSEDNSKMTYKDSVRNNISTTESTKKPELK